MSKYLIITLFIATIALSTVNGAIPSYIKRCKQDDPEVSKCIKNSVIGLKGKLTEGIPELEVPPIDPLTVPELVIGLGSGLSAVARNLKVSGAKDFELDKLSVDLAGDTFVFTISIPTLTAVGEYEVDGKLGAIPLKGKGPLTLIIKLITGEATLHGKKVERGGKMRYWFPSMDLKLDIKDYEIKLENLFEGDKSVGEATNKVLNTEKSELISTIIPGIEKSLVELVLNAANNVCKHFTYDELFL